MGIIKAGGHGSESWVFDRGERVVVKIVALAGGFGAAKFLSGLVRILPPEDLTVVVNTGDDFFWMGLYVCPDLDTITYTLAGLANPQTGWGVRGDTFQA